MWQESGRAHTHTLCCELPGLTDLLKSTPELEPLEYRINCEKTTKTMFSSKLEDKNNSFQEKGKEGGVSGAPVNGLGLTGKPSQRVPCAG